MFYSVVLLLVLLYLNCISCITINTKLGPIIGTLGKSRDGNTYYAFTGIPYAKPPIGKLRFKNPVEADAWQGTLNATSLVPRCLQSYQFKMTSDQIESIGEEDCLYLNIFTPQISAKHKLAILVYIHGGGFKSGYPGPKNCADYFMDENIMLVTVQYRLGIFGFLSANDTVIPGNFGLKDMAMALKWINKNIDSFGGNADKITVFGSSAGAVSANLLMMSPLSKNLIKGAISDSGVGGVWSYLPAARAKNYANKVAHSVGCQDKHGSQLLECLQQVSALQLLKQQIRFSHPFYSTHVLFPPVIELVGEDSFLTVDPSTTETRHPWMTGVANSEGFFLYGDTFIRRRVDPQFFITNIDTLLPDFIYHSNISKINLDIIKEKYFPQTADNNFVISEFVNLSEDWYFMYPMEIGINKHKGPVYQYYYDYRAANSFMDKYGKFNYPATHGDILIVLFNLTNRFPKYRQEDEPVSRYVVKLWSHFANNQSPTSEVELWPPYGTKKNYLHISEHPTVKQNLGQDIASWWSKLS